MAKKKKSTKSSTKSESTAPSYQTMLAARHRMNDAHSAVRRAERALRSAQSLNTQAHRDPAVAEARERLNEARQEASEATIAFETLKLKGGSRR